MDIEQYTAYIGGAGTGPDGGIHIVRANPETGELTFAGKSSAVDAPCYFGFSPDNHFLYSGMTSADLPGEKKGAVCAMRILPDGGLRLLNSLPCDAAKGSCYVSCSFDGEYVYAANYREGSTVFFRRNEDGTLAEKLPTVRHEGEKAAHAHCIIDTPDMKYVCVTDLGLDKIFLFKRQAGGFVQAGEVLCQQGSGPRHLIFSGNGRFAYLVCELGCVINVYAYEDGNFTFLQTVSTLEENNSQSQASAIRISFDGRLLLVGNRDRIQNMNRAHQPNPKSRSNSVAVFSVDKETGLLKLADICPSLLPRDLNISPNGRFVYVAGMADDRVGVFSLDNDGVMAPTPYFYDMKAPSCIMFRPIEIFKTLVVDRE